MLKKYLLLSVLAALALASSDQVDVSIKESSSFTASNKTEFTPQDIKDSGAGSFAGFLQKETGIDIYPNSGNKFAPAMDSRGFGGSNGWQNIAVIVDGVRLRSIDMQPINLSAIPLAAIEKITVQKGYGAASVGSGSSGAVIEVTTKKGDYLNGDLSYGSYNTKEGSAYGQKKLGDFLVSGGGSFSFSDGSRDINASGKDNSYFKEGSGKIGYLGNEALFEAGVNQYNSYQKYANALTQNAYDSNPAQAGTASGGQNYSDQSIAIRDYTGRGLFFITDELNGEIVYQNRDKKSDYISPYPYDSAYKYSTLAPTLSYNTDAYRVKGGVLVFDGSREDSTSKTSQDKNGYFADGSYYLQSWIFSAGVRYETTKYIYNPTTGSNLDDTKNANNYEAKAEYLLGKNTKLFGSYQQETTMPDIDRFFSYDFTANAMVFNGFIKPQEMKTYQAGGTYEDGGLLTKATLFYIDGRDEIYYYQDPSGLTSYNTNLDKTHKQGLELDAGYDFGRFGIQGLYNYTDAKIDHTSQANGAYNGKTMPGVYKHSVKLQANADVIANLKANADLIYKADAYAASDFANSFAQKQKNYSSFNLGARYTIRKNYEIYATVDNVFGYKNGYWISDDVIYPYNFETTYKIGGRISY